MEMTGTLTVLQRINQYEFAVEIKVMREGINRNRWDYRNLETYCDTFLGQPILCAFVHGKIGDGHNMKERTNFETGEKYYSFTDATAERIVGALSVDKEDFSIEEIDGEKWLVAKGRLWEFYAPELVEKIIRTGQMDVSAETMVEDSYQDGDIEVFTKWTGLGVTILGDDVQPAIPNASIKALELLNAEFAEAKLKAASYEQQESDQPQNNSKIKGDNRMIILNPRECSALQDTYFNDYKVLSAMHDDEKNETLICLMSDDGSTYSYIKADDETTIQPERIKRVSVNSIVNFDDERTLSVDVFEMMRTLSAKVEMLSADKKVAEGRADKAEADLKTMQEAEKNRRRKAAKASAKSALEKFNESAECQVEEKVLESIDEDVDDGEYDDCVNANGEWIGDELAKNAVYAECGKKAQKYNEEKVAKNNKVLVWEKDGGKAPTESGVKGILASLRNSK
jgi:hypothetical protein